MMRHRVKDLSEERKVKGECRHYWKIESAEGTVSRGVCKLCGAEQEFQNTLPDFTVVRRLPELPDVEIDSKRSNS